MKNLPNAGEWMVGLSFLGLLVLGGFMVVRALEPDPVQFESLEVKNAPRAGDLLIVEATVNRIKKTDCTNGVQVDSRDSAGVEARLPVPTRQVAGPFSRYAIVIPDVTKAGDYDLRIRETIYCDGRPRIAETPWLAFEVTP